FFALAALWAAHAGGARGFPTGLGRGGAGWHGTGLADGARQANRLHGGLRARPAAAGAGDAAGGGGACTHRPCRHRATTGRSPSPPGTLVGRAITGPHGARRPGIDPYFAYSAEKWDK